MKTLLIKTAVFTLTIILLGSCVQERVEPLSQKMSSQIALLPADANVLGYANIKQMTKSPFFELFEETRKEKHFRMDEYQEFLDSTGFDMEKDIHEIYFAGYVSDDDFDEKGIFVALGKYDPEKIMQYASTKREARRLEMEEYQNFKLYRKKNRDNVFCFADENTFVAGTDDHVKKWLDKSEKKSENTEIAPAILNRLEKVKYKSGAWFTLDAEKLIESLKEDRFAREFNGIKSIKSANFSAKVNDKLNFFGECFCTDSDKAELFRDAIKGFIATAKLSVSDDREAIDIINNIEVEQKGSSVTIDMRITKDEVEKLKAKKDLIVRR